MTATRLTSLAFAATLLSSLAFADVAQAGDRRSAQERRERVLAGLEVANAVLGTVNNSLTTVNNAMGTVQQVQTTVQGPPVYAPAPLPPIYIPPPPPMPCFLVPTANGPRVICP